MTDAELRELLQNYRNESIGQVVLRDAGTYSQTKFEQSSLETTERYLKQIKARDAAKERVVR